MSKDRLIEQSETNQPIERIGHNKLEKIDYNADSRFEVFTTPIEGLIVIQRPVYSDHRGSFTETFGPPIQRIIKDLTGFDFIVRQANKSTSHPYIFRGLHFEPESKLIHLESGAVCFWQDLRIESNTFGQVFTFTPASSAQSIFVPPGVANGFYVFGENDIDYRYMLTESFEKLPKGHNIALSGLKGSTANEIGSQLAIAGIEWPPKPENIITESMNYNLGVTDPSLVGKIAIISERDMTSVEFEEAVKKWQELEANMSMSKFEG